MYLSWGWTTGDAVQRMPLHTSIVDLKDNSNLQGSSRSYVAPNITTLEASKHLSHIPHMRDKAFRNKGHEIGI
jgi:hypothetical protein